MRPGIFFLGQDSLEVIRESPPDCLWLAAVIGVNGCPDRFIYILLKLSFGGRETSQQLRTHAALAEGPGLALSTHTVLPNLSSVVPGNLKLSADQCEQQATCDDHTHMRQNGYTQK